MKKIYILILMLAVSSYSFAALKTWIGASGGTWSLGTNWDGGVPGATDDVLFNTSVTVIVDGAKNINSLSLTSNAVVNLRGNNSTTIINIGGPVISLIDAGCTLTLTGTANSNKCEISMNSSSSATLSINGILNIGDVNKAKMHPYAVNANGEVINSSNVPLLFDSETGSYLSNPVLNLISPKLK